MGRGKGGVAAKIDLRRRSEPAQIIGIALGDEIGCLRQIVFDRDGLHEVIVEPLIERTDCRRIALEDLVGEGIDLIELEFHGS